LCSILFSALAVFAWNNRKHTTPASLAAASDGRWSYWLHWCDVGTTMP
jgi:hypothetical protein